MFTRMIHIHWMQIFLKHDEVWMRLLRFECCLHSLFFVVIVIFILTFLSPQQPCCSFQEKQIKMNNNLNHDLAAVFWLRILKNVTFQPKAVAAAYQIAKNTHTHTYLFYDWPWNIVHVYQGLQQENFMVIMVWWEYETWFFTLLVRTNNIII